MNQAYLRYYTKRLKEFLAIKTEMVNHQEIVRELASDIARSWIYYLMLLMSGLIALLGLLTNSVAVVIGAMLISPLMGPIISSGLALTIGNLPLARRAFRIIAISVVLTVLVTAFVTLLSPLKEPTAEILARVRPNIYDLFVAMLSGIVGGVALCTKRNYLITATGVAVATAVIPPLSVTGYGLGTGQLMLAMGGFLLFFTNFVAIVLTSNLVFFTMGFRSTHTETIQYSQRTRFLIIASVFSLISIPLVYTLVVDVKKVNTKKKIELVLKKNLNKDQSSRMTGFTYQKKDGKFLIIASVNTLAFIDKKARLQMESELKDSFQKPVDLELEQVIMASEKLQEESSKINFMNEKTIEKPRIETPAEIKGKVGRLLTMTDTELNQSFAPFHAKDIRLTFSGGDNPLGVDAVLQRDYPVGDDERLVVSHLLERTLGLPTVLHITTTPLLPEITFSKEGGLSPESIKALAIVKQLPGGPDGFRFLVDSPSRKRNKEATMLRSYLSKDLAIPLNSISQTKPSRKTGANNKITLRILRNKGAQ